MAKNYATEFDVMQLREDLSRSSFILQSILISNHIEYALLYYIKKCYKSDYSPKAIITLLNIFNAFTHSKEIEYQKKALESYFPIKYDAYEKVDFTYAEYLRICLGVNKCTISNADRSFLSDEKKTLQKLVDADLLQACRYLSKSEKRKYDLFFRISDKGLRFIASLCFYIREITDKARPLISEYTHNKNKSSLTRRFVKDPYNCTLFNYNLYKEGMDEVYGDIWKIENLSEKLKDRLLLPLEVFNTNMTYEYECELENLQLQKLAADIKRRQDILNTKEIPDKVKTILQKNITDVETNQQIHRYYREHKFPGRYTMIQEYRLYLRKLNKNPYIRVSRIKDEDYNFYRRMCNLSRLELDYYNAYRYDENAINSKADARKFSLAERKQLEQSYFTEQEVTWILRFKYNRYAFRLHKPHQTEKQIRGHQKSECLRVGLIYAINDDIRDNTLTKLSDEERAKFLELERQKRRAWFKYLVFMGKEDKNLRPMPGDDELMASVTEEVKAIKEKLKEERKERRKAEKQEEKDREKKLEQREKERAKLALQEKKKKQEALEKKKKAAEKMRMRKHRFDKKPASSSN